MEVRSVEAIVRALNAAEVEYLIVDGLAVNAYGFVRLTRDVDVVLQLDPGNVSKGLNALLDIGYQMSIPAKPGRFRKTGNEGRLAPQQGNDHSETLERRTSTNARRYLRLRT